MESKLRDIINYHGVSYQLKYWQGEVYELIEAISDLEVKLKTIDKYGIDYTREDFLEDFNHIAEEIADNMNMLKEFQLYYDFSDTKINDIMEFKANRHHNEILGDSNEA